MAQTSPPHSGIILTVIVSGFVSSVVCAYNEASHGYVCKLTCVSGFVSSVVCTYTQSLLQLGTRLRLCKMW